MANKINWNTIADEVTVIEDGKVIQNVGQVKEVIGILVDILGREVGEENLTHCDIAHEIIRLSDERIKKGKCRA